MAPSYEGRLFINNEYVASKSNERITIKNPTDASVVTEDVHVAGVEDVDLAVEAAATAFKTWRKTPPQERARLMNNLADILEKNVEKLSKLEAISMGMPIQLGQMLASGWPAWWRYYAGWTDKIAGEVYPDDGDGIYKLIRYDPIGVCAGIASWNVTLLYTVWKMAPAIAAGNTFIFKASEKSPLAALALGEMVKEASFPPGVINFISGGAATGHALASHMKIAKIRFTGSASTGKKVQIAAATSNLKRCTLELGGKSPALVFEDADMETTLAYMSQWFLLNSGQVCCATTRLLVQDTLADKFIEQLKARFEGATAAYGDPTEPTTQVGPLVDEIQYDRVMDFLEQGKKDGVKVLAGGDRHGDKGFYVQPTILMDPPKDSSVYKDEIFGPILAIKTFKTEEEAIELANDTTYGLAACVFTNDIKRALRVSGELEAGTVAVNKTVLPVMVTPFGGKKQSGNGREGGREGIMQYLESKSIHISMQ